VKERTREKRQKKDEEQRKDQKKKKTERKVPNQHETNTKPAVSVTHLGGNGVRGIHVTREANPIVCFQTEEKEHSALVSM
jgi:hypothetical protein